jgi:hypothetical protein
MSNASVAQTILEQLGGCQFVLMTGAKGLTGSADSLTFRLPSNFAIDGINAVRVRLTADDDYTVTFWHGRGTNFRIHTTRQGIYADDLRRTFTNTTGLDCTMGQIRRAS